MSLTKYDSYKDSGINWLETIPSHWRIKRVKEIGFVKARVGWKALKASEYVNKGYFFLATPNIKTKEIDFKNVNYITEQRFDESPEIKLNIDDILLTKDGSTLGTINIVKYLPSEGTVNSSIAVLRFNDNYINNYVFYQIQSSYIQNVITLKKDGAGVPHLFQRDINLFNILTPPIQEQQQIANYLDQQTKTIDKKISLLEAKIEHYQALKKSLINETVCRGLDKTVALKDSGIEWIGAIPEHWTETQFKRILFLLTDYDSNGSFSTIKENVNRVEKDKFAWFVRATDLTNYHKKVPTNDFIWVDKNSYNFLKKSKLYGGELLIAKRGEIGKTYLMPSVNFPATLGPNTYLARLIREEIIPLFAFYFFKTSWGINQLKLRNKSTTIGALYKDDFKSIQIFLPPIKEQQLIINYLDEKTGIIDQIIANIQSQVEQLKELRKSLINEVVTGKVRVPEMENMK